MGTRARPALRSSVVPRASEPAGARGPSEGRPCCGPWGSEARGGFRTGERPESHADRWRHLPVPPGADSRGSRVGVCAPSKTKIKDHISQESKTGGSARRDKPPVGGRGSSGHPGCWRREGQGGQHAPSFWGQQVCRKRPCDGRGRAGWGSGRCAPARPHLWVCADASRRLLALQPGAALRKGRCCPGGLLPATAT